jgi:hypothetical protein
VADVDDLKVGLPVAGEWSAGIVPRSEQTFGRDAAITRGRALLIYFKHRGVLNVEEFRRTNARGL